jgi:hypothetical protein
MKLGMFAGAAAAMTAASAAFAAPVLQFDVNSFHAQAYDSSNTASAFGGLSHTGSIQFSVGSGVLNGMFIQSAPFGPFLNAGLSGVTLTTFGGEVDLVNGQVTGGNIVLGVSNGDSYTCQITPGSGAVSAYVGGGFKVEALTRQGLFNDATFGNVDVSHWFNGQALGLIGSLLQFNFDPSASGAASSDMDLFVEVVPLPPTAAAGLATLGGIVMVRRLRRR